MRTGFGFDQYAAMCQRISADTLEEERWDEIVAPADLLPEILGLYDNGFRKGLTLGWSSLNEYFTARIGEFTVITGYPGSGKSCWLDNVMIKTADLHAWKWAVFSAENYPVSRHVANLIEIYTGQPFRSGPTPRMDRRLVESSIGWIQQYFRFIQPKEDRYSLDRIVQAAVQMGDIDALVIDPWNELDHSRPRDMREDEFISVSLTKLRWFARAADIHVFVVAHPAKYVRQPGKDRPVPSLNEVKGASEWYAKADNGIAIWRDETDTSGVTEVHVQKVRFREVGRAGNMIRLYYDRVTGRYTDPNHKPTIRELEQRHQGRLIREPGEDDE
jgi:twinkle protein